MNINKNFLFTVILLIFMPSLAQAETGREQLLSTIFIFINYIGFALGLYVLIYTIILLATKYADRDREITIGKLAVSLIVASVLMNITGTFNKLIYDLRGGESGGEYCFVYGLDDNAFDNLPTGDACYDVNGSPLAQDYISKIEDSEDKNMIMSNIRFGLAIFQIIGVIFFIYGFVLLRKVNMGLERGAGYMKPILIILFSALMVDLPHTIDVIIDALKQLEIFGFSSDI